LTEMLTPVGPTTTWLTLLPLAEKAKGVRRS